MKLRLLVAFFASVAGFILTAAEPPRVLILVGPSNHPPGTHEVGAGARLLQHCLEHMTNLAGVKAEVVHAWPVDPARLAPVRSVVLLGDNFPLHQLPDAAVALAQFGEMMQRGVGIVCLHYATGVRNEDLPATGEHPLLHWMGGYFATRCAHHQSIAKIYPAATITPAASAHPVSRGWKEFTLHDEPYINNYFSRDGNQPAPRVTVFATSQLPPEAPRREIVAWGIDRPDGGRGFGIVMPHFYRNWTNDDLRRFVLNAIVWSAQLEVPAGGVQTNPPDLAAFAPAAINPLPPKPKAAAKKS